MTVPRPRRHGEHSYVFLSRKLSAARESDGPRDADPPDAGVPGPGSIGAGLPDGFEGRFGVPGTASDPAGPVRTMRDFIWRLAAGRSPRFGSYSITTNGRLAHRLYFFPEHPAFPFMQPDDLNVIAAATAPEFRGRGLCTAALGAVLARFAAPTGTAWYVARADNVASLRAARRAGFRTTGSGTRVRSLSPGFFHQYELRVRVADGGAGAARPPASLPGRGATGPEEEDAEGASRPDVVGR